MAEEERLKCNLLIDESQTVKNIQKDIEFKVNLKKIDGVYLLSLEPFNSDKKMALVYMYMKKFFPDAFIIEEKKNKDAIAQPPVKVVEKKIYIEKKVPVGSEDESLWFALFSLAVIGVFALFLSSEQIKRLKQEYIEMRKKHAQLEEKQYEILSKIGENIHIITKETIENTNQLAKQVKSSDLNEHLDKVIISENELLDVTGNLIEFLRLKSKKTQIIYEVFNFYNVINEVSGILKTIFYEYKIDKELIYDIDIKIPQKLIGDSLHIGQIITNLLEYAIRNSSSREIILEVSLLNSLKDGTKISFQIDTEVKIDDVEQLFIPSYDEKRRRYSNLGLFTAKALIELMGGELSVQKSDRLFTIILPIKEVSSRKHKDYQLPDKSLNNKRVLIADRSYNAAQIIGEMFSYFKYDVNILTEAEFLQNMPNFNVYDIVVLDKALFTIKVKIALQKSKDSYGLKIIELDSLFATQEQDSINIYDLRLKKPFTKENIFDTILSLFIKEEYKDSSLDTQSKSPLIYRRAFNSTPNITVESFADFQGARLLLVEDNIINQKVVTSVLSKSGIDVTIASNGEESVNIVLNSDKEFDLVLMDINLPIMDGFVATQKIREDKRFNMLPIISLSALTSELEIEKIFNSGMNGYLLKPIEIGKLYTAFSLFLDKRLEIKKIDTTQNSVVAEIEYDFEHINIKNGLEYTNGNSIFYKEVLKEFLDAYGESDITLSNLIKEGRYEQLKILCIDIRGLSGTIGAEKLQGIIGELYVFTVYGKYHLLTKFIKAYEKELSLLIKDIEAYIA